MYKLLTRINNRRGSYTYSLSNGNLISRIMEIFPDACPFYVRKICSGKGENPFDMDYVLRFFLSGEYPKREAYKLDEESFEENLSTLENIFPDADPNFLHYHAVLCLDDKDKLSSFVAKTLEEGDYPVIQKNQSARKNGQFYICNCCYDEEVKPRDLGTCENGCVFCKSCIQRSVEVAYGEGRLDFPCLLDCSFSFSLQMLEDVLPRNLYRNIAQKKQIEEIKAAQIENLEVCPFCEFAVIPAQEDKIFCCQNSECLKESCRLCKQLSHLPLQCDEILKPDGIQKRIYIENKMSEALIRACYRCGIKFIKSEGCNRMKCSCGAMMCYLCGKPITDYTHFNGPGGDQYHLCPLFSDTDELHQQNIAEGAEKAKLDILLNKHTSNLFNISSEKLTPIKSAPKLPSEIVEDTPPPIPPRRRRKHRPIRPAPPPPVIRYISAIYAINDTSTVSEAKHALP